MKKLAFAILLTLILFPLATAQVNEDNNEQTFGTFKQSQKIDLLQLCSNCTFVNITSVVAPDSSIVLGQRAMGKADTRYNYTLISSNTTQLGRYLVNGIGDPDGNIQVWSYDFLVTPSGRSNLLGLFIIVMGLVYTITLVGFFGKNVWVTIIGGLLMMPLGLFTLINGIDIFRNFMTEAVSLVTMALGAFFAIFSLIAVIEDNM